MLATSYSGNRNFPELKERGEETGEVTGELSLRASDVAAVSSDRMRELWDLDIRERECFDEIVELRYLLYAGVVVVMELTELRLAVTARRSPLRPSDRDGTLCEGGIISSNSPLLLAPR